MRHDYNQRKQNRVDYANDQAAKKRGKASQLFNRAHEISSVTQVEPIKIGHHSEKRHRRDLERMDNSMRSGIQEENKADYYEEKAKTIESNTSISSDDPEAVEKLEQKLQAMTDMQEFMKAANKSIKKNDKDGFLKLRYGSEKLWAKLTAPELGRWTGFQSYQLTNNNANIKRVRDRLASLKTELDKKTTERVEKGVTVKENVEAGRLQLCFPSKPSDEVRVLLRRTFGFNWCRSEKAWQRKLNNAARNAATSFMAVYKPE